MVFQFEDQPADVSSGFVGRQAELEALTSAFRKGAKTIVVEGLAGLGKTALANAYAERNKHLFPGGVLHSHASYAETADDLIHRVLAQAPTEPTLLIIDDAETFEQRELERLQKQLSTFDQLQVILTSRDALRSYEKDQILLTLSALPPAAIYNYLRSSLPQETESQLNRISHFVEGNPLLANLAVQLLRSNDISFDELVSRVRNFERPGLTGIDGKPLNQDSTEHQRIIVDVRQTNDEILRRIQARPELMRLLTPRKFEEIIAEILTRQGYEVNLTPATRDGGFDMYAAKHELLGSFLFLIECKRYTPPHHVGVDVVRSLHGVVQNQRANAGIIVTSSFFTSGAQNLQQDIFHQMHLRDYIAIQEWLTPTL